ncbi:MAG: FtsQ-type POTRA domain-containing protein [Micrococcales bacterium]|nr:FtsQ-type POTRA domain-containing protein [Micrococcales bacterium]
MQPPKSRYSNSPGPKPRQIKAALKPKPIKIPLRQRKSAKREINRFTGETKFAKYFIRSLLAGLLALILLVLSTMFTPLLAIEKIKVTGNKRVPTAQIEAALKHRVGSALTMVGDGDIATDLAKFKLIESISLVSKPPHLLEVRVTERTPISIVIRGGVKFLYDPAGVNLGAATGNEKIPTILVKDDPKTSTNYKQAIDVLLALPAQLLDRVAYIQAKSKDNVTMQLRGYSAQTIIWGDSSNSILKSKVLKALLLKTPTNVRATFDVSAPLTPSVIR